MAHGKREWERTNRTRGGKPNDIYIFETNGKYRLWVTAYYNIYAVNKEDKLWRKLDNKIQGKTYDKLIKHEFGHLFDLEEAVEEELRPIEENLASTKVTDELRTKINEIFEEAIRGLTTLFEGLNELIAVHPGTAIAAIVSRSEGDFLSCIRNTNISLIEERIPDS